ncbi:MAG: alpha/beta hydrolase [Solirubrobacteraceae bacterium]
MPNSAARLSDRVQSAVVRGLAGLPDGFLRLITGRPISVDSQQLHPETQLGLKLLELAGTPPLQELTPAEARDRVAHDARTFEGPKIQIPEVRDLKVGDGGLAARLYVPNPPETDGPLIVYFHGGGFVVGDLDTHDNLCRMLARCSGARILAIGYRLAPEMPFPGPVEDCLTGFRFAVEHHRELGADPNRIGVAGDSAGGNLATVVARMALTGSDTGPAFQLLFYPWLDLAHKRRSYELFGEGFYLTESDLDWYRDQYLAQDEDASDPRCSPLLADDLSRLPPAYIATAGFDPLRDDGEAYAQRLRAAGVPAALRRHTGLIHGFANTVGVGHVGREAVLEAAGALQVGLAGTASARLAATGA